MRKGQRLKLQERQSLMLERIILVLRKKLLLTLELFTKTSWPQKKTEVIEK
jgi:hypothetical protein